MSDNRDKTSCVLVTSHIWSQDMVRHLCAKTGRNFLLITALEDLTIEKLIPINPEFIFFPHWSHHIDSSIYERYECVVFHMTDLPYGRGGSPLQNLIVRGIRETKISALRCVGEMDAGPIYMKKPLSLHGSAEEIYMRASNAIENMITEITIEHPDPIPQEGLPTVFKRRKPEEGNLAIAQSLEQLYDMIRMLDAEGYPSAFLEIGPFKLEFTRASRKVDQVVTDVRITLADNTKKGVIND